MLLLIDGAPGSDLSAFLMRLQEETMPCTIMLYEEWRTHIDSSHENTCDSHDPEGIIFMRVMPEIAYKRLRREPSSSLSLDHIKQVSAQKEEFFIHNKNTPTQLQHLPVLVLNGNIDFQTDFSQFYNHLFYIRRLVKQIQEKKDMALGIYQEKVHRKCC